MWDPRTYEDTDYGLDEGESFEPEFDIDDEPFDPSLPHVMTVLGPLEPEELGVCIPATRFLPARLAQRPPEQRDRARARALAEAGEELEAFATVGGRSVVDIATAQTGRDIGAIQRLTQLVPSHLIVAAGLPADDRDPIAHLAAECAGGLDGSAVAPGLVVLGASASRGTSLAAAHGVARDHGLPALVLVNGWSDVGRILETVSDGSSNAPALMLGGPGAVPDDGIIAQVAGAGAFLVIEVPTTTTPPAERALAERLVGLIRSGFGDAILVTIDLVSPWPPVAAPVDARSPYLIDRLAIAMMEAGASAHDVRRIMIENPARALTIVPPASSNRVVRTLSPDPCTG